MSRSPKNYLWGFLKNRIGSKTGNNTVTYAVPGQCLPGMLFNLVDHVRGKMLKTRVHEVLATSQPSPETSGALASCTRSDGSDKAV